MNGIKEVIKQRVLEKEQKRRAQNSLLFIFLVTSFLAFLTLFIYYHRHYNPQFKLNEYFMSSSALIVLCSISIHVSFKFYNKDELENGFICLLVTAMLTLGFGFVQLIGWDMLRDSYPKVHVAFTNYLTFMIVSVFHFIHVIGGLVYLGIVTYKHFSYNIHSRDINPIKIAAYYWHFLGAVWLITYALFY